MQFAKTLLATAILAFRYQNSGSPTSLRAPGLTKHSVAANKHKYCNCHVDGALDNGPSHRTCTRWG